MEAALADLKAGDLFRHRGGFWAHADAPMRTDDYTLGLYGYPIPKESHAIGTLRALHRRGLCYFSDWTVTTRWRNFPRAGGTWVTNEWEARCTIQPEP